MRILICGGAGYIGSHTSVLLGQQGHDLVAFDNLSNSSRIAVDRVGELLGSSVEFIEGDIRSNDDLARAFAEPIDAVIHFAALKAVGESWNQPLAYFENNITGTISLLHAMNVAGVRKLIFSSSAAVYGEPDKVPVDEFAKLQVTNPYGRTKLVMEDLIRDYCASEPGFAAVLLRYFNPVGAHPSGRIGEDCKGTPSNLMPCITQVAAGRREQLRIFGDDYPTPDGSGIRDYIHVMDLAEAHVKALDFVSSHDGCHVFNLGAGHGCSVLELVNAFEAATGIQIPRIPVGRRPGDVAELWADTTRAREVLQWQTRLGLERMCKDAWSWQKNNPNGYEDA